MALARVQATGKVTADSALSVALTFATPPSVGNGVVVLLTIYSSAASFTCVDNRGNTYTLAKRQLTGPSEQAIIFFCAAVTTSAAPFTITVSTGGGAHFYIASALEVSGVGAGLVLDQTASGTATSATPATAATPALTADEVLLAGTCSINGAEASITVAVVSPVWTQEHEELSFSHAVGEGNSRIVTGALGTTPSLSWSMPTSRAWAAALAAFKGSTPVAGEMVQTYVWGPL